MSVGRRRRVNAVWLLVAALLLGLIAAIGGGVISDSMASPWAAITVAGGLLAGAGLAIALALMTSVSKSTTPPSSSRSFDGGDGGGFDGGFDGGDGGGFGGWGDGGFGGWGDGGFGDGGGDGGGGGGD